MMAHRRILCALGLLGSVSLVACFDDAGDASPTATPPVPTMTATAEARPTATQTVMRPTPPPTIGPPEQIPSTVWLIDVRDGKAVTLYEDHDARAITAYFDDREAVVLTGIDFDEREAIRFDLDGNELGRAPQGIWGDCTEADGGVDVLVRFYPGVACGPISPDGRWMIYWIDEGELRLGPNGPEEPVRTEWVLDLETGKSMVLHGDLSLCLGDSFFQPAWSPSSRFVYFNDCAEDGRTFLSDVVTSTTRQIATGIPTYRAEPSWSPVADVLLYPAGDGSAVIEDLEQGTREGLMHVPWPVRFDTSGSFFMTLAPRGGPNQTTVFETSSRTQVAELSGAAAYQVPYGNLLLKFVPLAAGGGSFVAALGGAPGCGATSVYQGGTLIACVEGAHGPSISPDGSQVVLARKTGTSGHVEGPGFGSVGMDIYDIGLLDVATGAETVLASGALGGNPYPTPAFWNEAGTHLLVTWPFLYGP